jgi:hypothetical protein
VNARNANSKHATITPAIVPIAMRVVVTVAIAAPPIDTPSLATLSSSCSWLCLLVAYADELLGRGGRLTEALRRLYGRQLLARPNFGEYLRRNGRGREVDMAVTPAGL